MTKIGFIGLGHMGAPMVKNLMAANNELFVYDIMPQSISSMVACGAHGMDSVTELAKNTEIIFTSVQSSEQVKEICLGKNGLFSNARAGLLYIDCSSIEIHMTQILHASAQRANIAMLDAPVSGGVSGAKAGTLTFMVGGSEENFKRALPILKKMGKHIVHAGVAGLGQAAKICNNLLLAISMIGVCEAFTLAEKLGLDAKKFYEISSNASGQCWAMTTYCPFPDVLENVPANNHYQPGFMAKMMLKDLHLSQHAAQEVNAFLPLGALATELYKLFVAQGQGEVDFSGIIKLISAKTPMQ